MKEWKIIKDWVTPSGLRACCIINYKGTINGYVEVTKPSQYYGLAYYVYSVNFEDLTSWTDKAKVKAQQHLNDIDVHGGLTFAAEGSLTYLPSSNWWFGFDTAHSGDRNSVDVAIEYIAENAEDIKELHRLAGLYSFQTGTYKDLDYVARECEKLAEQLK